MSQLDLDYIRDHAEILKQYSLTPEFSDFTIIVDDKKLPAHKIVLAAGSDYFRGLLSEEVGGNDQNEIEIKNAPIGAFKMVLNYMYSGRLDLSSLGEDTILGAFNLAHRFGLQSLKSNISKHLREIILLRNVCAILDAARSQDSEDLTNACYEFMDRNAVEILDHESFSTLSIKTLYAVLSRNSFFAPEISILKAVCKWCENNVKLFEINNEYSVKDTLLKCVRLQLIPSEELMVIVRKLSCINCDMVIDTLLENAKQTTTYLPYRGNLYPGENVASKSHGSTVLEGLNKEYLLDSSLVYDNTKGYTHHVISEAETKGIVVKLGKPCIINYIKTLLWDKDARSYSYYVEISYDNKSWLKILNYSKYHCQSWQRLYFQQRAVQYIRFIGTNCTVTKAFHLVSLEAKYKQKIPQLIDNVIKPSYNVATVNLKATVEGTNPIPLLDGNWDNHTTVIGYTHHAIGTGAIIVKLAQPYLIDSLKMRLWDRDERLYSYYVETSINKIEWEMAVDKRNEDCKSWQTLRFSPRPVIYVKIVGTKNTIDKGAFHLVHFECPAQGFQQ